MRSVRFTAELGSPPLGVTEMDDSKRLETEGKWDRLVGLIKKKTGKAAGDVERKLHELMD